MSAVVETSTGHRPSPLMRLPDLGRMWRDAPLFTRLALFLLMALIPLYAAMALDGRTFDGESPWLKPVKFHYALSIYLISLAFFARYLPPAMRGHRLWGMFSVIVCLAVIGEVLWLSAAAMQNTASHFNTTEPLFVRLYPVMGVLAVTLTLPSLIMGIAIGRNKDSGLEPALRVAIALGLGLTFFSTVVVAGYLSSGTGHAVGVSTRDLWLLGWSRDAGDLRVAHFFATHALHGVPLAGVVAAALLPARFAMVAVVVASLAYAALVGGTFMQALNGQPFLPWLG
ncbi:MAG: hypothetical protein MUC58_01145 [Rhizobiaceae bacterium]|jgi:hypothetical protein|nr:hypothetical protein [Rhizobiaceae bacterium]